MTTNLHWFKCGNDGHWCSLENLNLQTATESGVYIIWHGGSIPRVVYVGQGDPVSTRFTSHRKDARIQKYKDQGLYVTWASVPAAQRDGVERYLADTWNPLVGDAHPDAYPVAVNSPW